MSDKLLVTKSFDQLYIDSTRQVTFLKKINDELQASEPEQVRYTHIQDEKDRFGKVSSSFKDILKQMEKIAIVSQSQQKRLLTKRIKQNKQKKASKKSLINWQYDNNKEAMFQIRRSSIAQKVTKKLEKSGTINSSQYQDEFEEQLRSMKATDQTTLDQLLIQERTEELALLAKDTLQLQKMVNEVGLEVNKQDVDLDIVKDNQTYTKNNLIEANKQLNGAQEQQKKAGCKILICSVIVILILAASFGLYFVFR